MKSFTKKRRRVCVWGQTDWLRSAAVTSIVVSGSSDETIRVWNLLQKGEETDLGGGVISDDKYIVSGP